MKNRDIYSTDPSTRKLVNEGVASVNDEMTSKALEVLRYELETFVCDGQYEKGMSHILETYIKNIDQAQQPSVWVSGFYGSGKSHLVKMLRALWVDTNFEDGATARGLANLPQNVVDLFKELSTLEKRHGYLFAASGTLGSSASGSVRLALLSIIFKAAGLPEQFQVAKFVMWLKSEGIYDSVKAEVESAGFDWIEELDNFYVAEGLHEALAKVKPNLFSSPTACAEALHNQYPYVQDVSSDEMIKAIRLALTVEDKFPLTLIVLDEVQQFIGESSERSIAVQEMVESVTKNIGGKLMFIGTGQTAVTGTANLARLQGRFTMRIELSDADVDTVIRKVILAKKPEATTPIDSMMQTNLGEISRHLSGSTIGHRQADIAYFSQDYPILPVRRRFWENALRILDQTGTDSQLRNQLSMIHKVIQSNLDATLGTVVPADYLYFDSAEKLLQARVLPRKVHEKTLSWYRGNEDEKLMARASGLVFLINKLSGSNNELGISATVDTLADLMVEDLSAGSAAIRSKLPALLDKCDLLMKVGEEYRIQTEESAAWNDEFLNQRSQLANETYRIENERNDRIRKKFGEIVRKLSLTQGDSKVSREISPLFESQLPKECTKKICVWVRDGWSIDENSVRADAREAGNSSPAIFVFIPKRSADDLRHHMIEYKAALATLEHRGVPNTAEGTEAKAAMETIKQTAESRINDLLNDAFSGARVFQGGGNEIAGNSLQEMINEASQNALSRLYPHFGIADHNGWAKVYDKAKVGAADALNAIGDAGEVAQNAVCKAVLGYIAGGKSGTDIRNNFEEAPYGWSRDAVDGALQVLQVAGLIRAENERGVTIDYKELERKAIGKTNFKIESTTISAVQRIGIRKLLQSIGINAKPNEELQYIREFLQKVQNLAQSAGGESPKPQTPNISSLESIRLSSGNEQLLALYNQRDELTKNIENWQNIADQIQQRWPLWSALIALVEFADDMTDADVIRSQMVAIQSQRQLLAEPDPITPLINGISQMLRDELNRLNDKYQTIHAEGMQRLEQDENWKQLDPDQRHRLLSAQKLTNADIPNVKVGTTPEILETLKSISLSGFADRVAAMRSRFDSVAAKAAELLEPEIKSFHLPKRTLKTSQDVETWLEEIKQQLQEAIGQGPIMIR